MFWQALALSGILSAWAAIIYARLRHLALSAIVFLAPMLVVIGIRWIDLRYWGYAHAIDAPVYIFAAVWGLLIADHLVRDVCSGVSSRDAYLKACRSVIQTVGPPSVALLLAFGAVAILPGFRISCAIAVLALLFATAMTVMAVGLSLLFPFAEQFIARANHARERDERLVARFAGVGQSRWAFSIAGMTLVIAALAGFGMRGLIWAPVFRFYFVLMPVLTFSAFTLVTRDWRMAAGMTLALALAGALFLTTQAHNHTPLSVLDALKLSIACATGAAPMMVIAASWRRSMREGDDTANALARALQQEGPGAFSAAMLATTPALVLPVTSLLFGGLLLLPERVTAIASGVAVFLVFPALVTAIYKLFPRYRSVEEVFGKR